MRKKEEGKYVPITTKISARSYERLMRIARRKGLNIYALSQNVYDSFIRHMDDSHNLTPENEKILATFEHMIGWADNFTLTDPKAKPQVAEATYYLTDQNGKNDVRVVHVERPFFGQWKQNFNVQQILERFLCLTYPQLYKRLLNIANCRDCSSIYELLIDLACELEREEDKKEFIAPFADANRSEWGRQPHERPYRIRHEKTNETLFKEELI